MLYPFVGMDPYLEAPAIWPDFHERVSVELSGELNESLPPPYYAIVEKRTELGIIFEAGATRHIVPDTLVVRPPISPVSALEGGVMVADQPRIEIAQGVQLRAQTEPFFHPFVEIRDAAHGHKLVTLIEIVSPSNKRAGPDRRAYEAKQREVLESDAHMIELDLLRAGRRLLPYPELDEAVYRFACDYLVVLNRSNLRQDTWIDYTLYPIDVREILPVIPVPLGQGDSDVALDLQTVAQRAYRRGPYLRAIDYTQPPPEPAFSPEKVEWINARLRAVKLRV
ncbi:MAG: DUF4058 family protein [Chloroflexi bacterium]|nr:DUF4058 family protein [Chloroflexota bacterium]